MKIEKYLKNPLIKQNLDFLEEFRNKDFSSPSNINNDILIEDAVYSNKIENVHPDYDFIKKYSIDKISSIDLYLDSFFNDFKLDDLYGIYYFNILNKLLHNLNTHLDIALILSISNELFIDDIDGGRFKNLDNVIGNNNYSVKTVPMTRVGDLLIDLTTTFNNEIKHSAYPILNILQYIFDFLMIHPFNDGNGRISRILTSFLLLQNGYNFILSKSLNKLIYKNLNQYYESLKKANNGWDRDKEDLTDFILFITNLMVEMLKKRNNTHRRHLL